MLEQLQGHLSKIIKNIKGQGKISESNISDVLRDIRIALLEADVNLKVAKKFVEHVKEKALGEKVLNSISPGQQFTKILFDELKFFLGDDSKQIEFDSSGQTIIVLAGLHAIPPNLYEAAEMDGTSRERTFFRIPLPLLMPNLRVVFIIARNY